MICFCFLAFHHRLRHITANGQILSVLHQIKVDGRVKNFSVYAVVEISSLVKKFKQVQVRRSLQHTACGVFLHGGNGALLHIGLHGGRTDSPIVDGSYDNLPSAVKKHLRVGGVTG